MYLVLKYVKCDKMSLMITEKHHNMLLHLYTDKIIFSPDKVIQHIITFVSTMSDLAFTVGKCYYIS